MSREGMKYDQRAYAVIHTDCVSFFFSYEAAEKSAKIDAIGNREPAEIFQRVAIAKAGETPVTVERF